MITQDAVLATFDRILRALTLAVGGIAAISLAVAGILIMNVMLIAVTQRRREIGLLKALGATGRQIRLAFFTEAVLLALGGAAVGVAAGNSASSIISQVYPAIPFQAPWWALVAAPVTAIVTAMLFTVGARAARRDARSGAGAVAQVIMRSADFVRFTYASLRAHRLRTALTALGIAVGIAAVILLTSIGEGLHRFVIAEFTQFGTNIISVTPGAHPDARRVARRGEHRAAAHHRRCAGAAPRALRAGVRPGGAGQCRGRVRRQEPPRHALRRRARLRARLQMRVATGEFLPQDDPRSARAFVVLGSKVARELFGGDNPLGSRIRVGGERYRVVGVMQSKGQVLGFDLDDTVYIPVGRALEMFNRESLQEIHVIYEPTAPLAEVEEGIKRILIARHGAEDFTVTPQQKMLEVFGTVLDAITFAVAAIGGISLVVGGVGILTILTIAVAERTSEIGLLRAVGATQRASCCCFSARRRCWLRSAARPDCCSAGASRSRCRSRCRRCRCTRRGATRCWPNWWPSGWASPRACCRRGARRALDPLEALRSE